MNEKKVEQENVISLSHLLREFRSVLRKRFWLPLLLAVVCGGAWFLYQRSRYTPMYASEVTFTISVSSSSSSDISRTSAYYSKATAEQLSKTFPYLIQSDLLYTKLSQAMGVSRINGTITATNVPDTNLFTVRVTSSSADDALAILQKLIEVYPEVADYVIGNTSMDLLTEPYAASAPYNAFHPFHVLRNGVLAGLAAGLLLLMLAAGLRRTIREERDVQLHLNQTCLAALPCVSFRRSGKKNPRLLSINNDQISSAYQEGVRALRTKLLRALSGTDRKVLLVSSTMPGEGKTTVSVNLALSLARKGARVILVDADLRRPSVKAALGIREPSQGLIDAAALDDPAQSASLLTDVEGSTLRLLAGDTPRKDARQAPVRKIFRVIDFLRTQADYIILDTPPCGLLADSVSLARAADCAIYVLGAGAVQAPQALDGIQYLAESGTALLGCVLNGVQTHGQRYGYGYGYHYGYGYGYGHGRGKYAAVSGSAADSIPETLPEDPDAPD